MTDVLAERCAALADVAIELMRVSMESQTTPARLSQVSTETARMRAVVDLGVEGIESQDYLRWSGTILSTLAEMESCAERGDARGVWTAFTHPVTGMAGLGQACSGYPRW